MTKLREKLKFSDTKVVEHAVKIRKWHDTKVPDFPEDFKKMILKVCSKKG